LLNNLEYQPKPAFKKYFILYASVLG
jgi:hypothetical protein